MFSRYCSANRRRLSAPVSSSSSDSLSESVSASMTLLRITSSSEPLLDIDSSRRALAGPLLVGFAPVLVVFLLFVEGATLASSRLRFRWDAGVVKKEDMAPTGFSSVTRARRWECPHSVVCDPADQGPRTFWCCEILACSLWCSAEDVRMPLLGCELGDDQHPGLSTLTFYPSTHRKREQRV